MTDANDHNRVEALIYDHGAAASLIGCLLFWAGVIGFIYLYATW